MLFLIALKLYFLIRSFLCFFAVDRIEISISNMIYRLFILFIVCFNCTLYPQKTLFIGSLIPNVLKENVNSCIRDQSIDVEIVSQKKHQI